MECHMSDLTVMLRALRSWHPFPATLSMCSLVRATTALRAAQADGMLGAPETIRSSSFYFFPCPKRASMSLIPDSAPRPFPFKSLVWIIMALAGHLWRSLRGIISGGQFWRSDDARPSAVTGVCNGSSCGATSII